MRPSPKCSVVKKQLGVLNERTRISPEMTVHESENILWLFEIKFPTAFDWTAAGRFNVSLFYAVAFVVCSGCAWRHLRDSPFVQRSTKTTHNYFL